MLMPSILPNPQCLQRGRCGFAFNPNRSLDFNSCLRLFRAGCDSRVEGIAGYVETRLEARCRKKRWQGLKRIHKVLTTHQFRSNDRLGFNWSHTHNRVVKKQRLSYILVKMLCQDFAWNREWNSRFYEIEAPKTNHEVAVRHVSSCVKACFAPRLRMFRGTIGHVSHCG